MKKKDNRQWCNYFDMPIANSLDEYDEYENVYCDRCYERCYMNNKSIGNIESLGDIELFDEEENYF